MRLRLDLRTKGKKDEKDERPLVEITGRYAALIVRRCLMIIHNMQPAKVNLCLNKNSRCGIRQDVPQVEISPEQQKLVGVKTVKVALMPMKKVIRTVGRIEADESRQATVNAKVEGWIEKLYVDTTGSYVKKGEKLAEIYSPELVATQQEFLTALKWSKETAAGSAGEEKGRASELNKMLARDAGATLDGGSYTAALVGYLRRPDSAD